MAEGRTGGGSRITPALVLAIVIATINVAVLARIAGGDWNALQALIQGSATALSELLRSQIQTNALSLAYLVASPLLLATIVALLGGGSPAAAAPAPQAPVETKKPGEEALRLLRVLQDDARLIDFIQEDIDTYDDAQVGAAARSIHAGCRKALDGRVTLERIFDEDEGDRVSVDAGFDPAQVRLSGNVGGAPPFSGTLQHGGWRAVAVHLPESPGGFDPSVIAPAEVEIA
jgi:hypothetical protein